MPMYGSYSVTEEMIERAEKAFHINTRENTSLEAFTINKNSDRVLMKVSSPHARYDEYFAQLMVAMFGLNDITYTKDGRNVVISTEDFIKLFGEEE